MEYGKTDEYIKAIQSLDRNKIYIVGAGKYGKRLGKYFNKHKILWEGYIDREIVSQQINGKSVYSYEKVSDGYYVISTCLYRREIEDELKKRNIESDKIIAYTTPQIMCDIYEDLINWEEQKDKIKGFKGKHNGERCFIIGNGPSLRIDDLDEIKNDISFASNTIYAVYPYTRWRPMYYCATDVVFCREMMSQKENLELLSNGCEALFTSMYSPGIQFRDDEEIKSYYMKILYEKNQKKFPCFSVDCSEQVCAAGSITYIMLQLAVYMGFKKIYLLGMDFSYTVERRSDNTVTENNVSNHMDVIEKEEERFYDAITKNHGMSYIADVDMQLAGYLEMKKYADSHDIKIYNATRGGKLEVFERVDFDSLFE